VAPVAAGSIRIEQRIDRVAGPATRLVVVGADRAARLARRALVEQRQPRPRAVVHRDDPVGEPDDGIASGAVAGQPVVEQQPGGVVVLVARSAAVAPDRAVLAAVRPMRARRGWTMMIGVPEQSAA